MSSPVGQILKSINTKNERLSEEFVTTHYVPFVVNRAVSLHYDSAWFALEAEKLANLPVYDQYLWYFYSLPKASRFAKWGRVQKDDIIETVSEFYNVSRERAREYVRVLSKDAIESILKKMSKGGTK